MKVQVRRWEVIVADPEIRAAAHDKALMGRVAVPEPDELLADINSLATWRDDIEKRSKNTAKRRKT